MSYTFTLDLQVDDPEILYAAAMKHAIEVDGIDSEDAEETLAPDGQIDAAACLVMLLDPGSVVGCSVFGSQAEADPVFETSGE